MNIKNKKIGIIGAGVMGQALLNGLIQSNKIKEDNLWCSVKSELSLEKIKFKITVPVFIDFSDHIGMTDVFIICTKPKYVCGVLDQLNNSNNLKKNVLIISIAAAVTIETMQSHLPAQTAIIRAMPNTPCKINSGITVISRSKEVTPDDVDIAKSIFENVGQCIELDESHLDAVTAVSGSGPAYIFLMMEALTDGAVRVGLPRDVAIQLVSQTMLGSAKMLQVSKKHPAALKDEVTTPAGCTIAGLLILEDGKIRSTLARAVEEATQTAKDLG